MSDEHNWSFIIISFFFFSVLKTWSKINAHDTCKTWVPSSVLCYFGFFLGTVKNAKYICTKKVLK